MARFALGVVCGMIISTIAGAAFATRASSPEDDDPGEIPAETLVTAIRVGLDARALHGAVVTTRATGAVEYLQHEGLLPRPQPIVVTYEPPRSVWDILASCESNGRWNVSTGNGYFGGLQFDRQTWLAYGGSSYAPTANLASRAQQIAVAERVRATRGYQPWPACRRILRLP